MTEITNLPFKSPRCRSNRAEQVKDEMNIWREHTRGYQERLRAIELARRRSLNVEAVRRPRADFEILNLHDERMGQR